MQRKERNGNIKICNSERASQNARVLSGACVVEYDYHSLRHTFATNLVNSGAPPEYVQRLLGHSKLAVTMDTYYRPTDEHRREQAEEIREKLRQHK